MVLFKFTTSSNSKSYYIVFTFHYGSIQILCSTYKVVCSYNIYIPLWFYSNDTYKKIQTQSLKFTFHYGSIQIDTYKKIQTQSLKFTFHYGSIQIGVTKQAAGVAIKFTFHYGSIQII